jgi:predicted nucleotidyltransferase component of viral defense system
MSLFDQLVDSALHGQPGLVALRPVVEKELLHQDILRELSEAGLLQGLTFIGGTCLRLCYGSQRLSEDLDFTGGGDFDRITLGELSSVLVTRLEQKYGLQVSVDEPVKESGNVVTWRLRLQTRQQQKPQHQKRSYKTRRKYQSKAQILQIINTKKKYVY